MNNLKIFSIFAAVLMISTAGATMILYDNSVDAYSDSGQTPPNVTIRAGEEYRYTFQSSVPLFAVNIEFVEAPSWLRTEGDIYKNVLVGSTDDPGTYRVYLKYIVMFVVSKTYYKEFYITVQKEIQFTSTMSFNVMSGDTFHYSPSTNWPSTISIDNVS